MDPGFSFSEILCKKVTFEKNIEYYLIFIQGSFWASVTQYYTGLENRKLVVQYPPWAIFSPGFISFSLLIILLMIIMWESLEKLLCRVLVETTKRNFKNTYVIRCTGCHNITEIMLKMALPLSQTSPCLHVSAVQVF